MTIKEELGKAVGAHGLWKSRLKRAIDTKTSEYSVEKVRVDNECDFGRWLHHVGAPVNASADWKEVRRLHAEFHAVAAKTLGEALVGHRAEASAMLEVGGAFTKASDALTRAMITWQRKS